MLRNHLGKYLHSLPLIKFNEIINRKGNIQKDCEYTHNICEQTNDMFGMYEMECAVRYLIFKSDKEKIKFNYVSISPDDFDRDTDTTVMIGFWNLLKDGWLETRVNNYQFYPTNLLCLKIYNKLPELCF